jgi:hypothetical protein
VLLVDSGALVEERTSPASRGLPHERRRVTVQGALAEGQKVDDDFGVSGRTFLEGFPAQEPGTAPSALGQRPELDGGSH